MLIWGNMKIMDLQNSFTQIYMFKRDNAEIKKKTRTRPCFTKCTVTTNRKCDISKV